jgi:hypothetical protein
MIVNLIFYYKSIHDSLKNILANRNIQKASIIHSTFLARGVSGWNDFELSCYILAVYYIHHLRGTQAFEISFLLIMRIRRYMNLLAHPGESS